jgi:hypothetical protein
MVFSTMKPLLMTKRDALPSRVPLSPKSGKKSAAAASGESDEEVLLAVAQQLRFTPAKIAGGDLSIDEPTPRPLAMVPLPIRTAPPIAGHQDGHEMIQDDPTPIPASLQPLPSPRQSTSPDPMPQQQKQRSDKKRLEKRYSAPPPGSGTPAIRMSPKAKGPVSPSPTGPRRSVSPTVTQRFPLRCRSASPHSAAIVPTTSACRCASRGRDLKAAPPAGTGQTRSRLQSPAARVNFMTSRADSSPGLSQVAKTLSTIHNIICTDDAIRQTIDINNAHHVLLHMDKIVRESLILAGERSNSKTAASTRIFDTPRERHLDPIGAPQSSPCIILNNENGSPRLNSQSETPSSQVPDVGTSTKKNKTNKNMAKPMAASSTAVTAQMHCHASLKQIVEEPSPQNLPPVINAGMSSTTPNAAAKATRTFPAAADIPEDSKTDASKNRAAWLTLVRKCRGSLSERELELLSEPTLMRLASSMQLDAKEQCRVELYAKHRQWSALRQHPLVDADLL